MTGASDAPALVAYDGSAYARAALREAAVLFPGRLLLIATVWEAGLAMMPLTSAPGEMGPTYLQVDPEVAIAVDRVAADHASHIAQEGARLGREAGATTEAVAIADELHPAETLARIAEDRDVAIIVVGSHGRTGWKARLHGSTTQGLLHKTRRPVLIVRADD